METFLDRQKNMSLIIRVDDPIFSIAFEKEPSIKLLPRIDRFAIKCPIEADSEHPLRVVYKDGKIIEPNKE